MGYPQTIEGTSNEIAVVLQSEPFAHLKLQIIVDQDEVALTASLPTPPFAVRDREHLIELLIEGVNSPTHPVTEGTWKELHDIIDKRHVA